MPAAEAPLELDELWSFVARKRNVYWVWLALNRETRQIVGFAVGDRDEATARKLWESIPTEHRRGLIYTDFLESYFAVVPEEQHRPGLKDGGQTNHVERANLTLRQRLARLVRKTLSFSKSLTMHLVCLRLFLWRYNRDLQRRWWLDQFRLVIS